VRVCKSGKPRRSISSSASAMLLRGTRSLSSVGMKNAPALGNVRPDRRTSATPHECAASTPA
jgi:hypothetical protein